MPPFFHDFVCDLIGDVLHVGSTFAGADAVDKADLLELAITKTTDNFPPVWFFFNNLRKIFVLFGIQVKVAVFFEILNLKIDSIEFYPDTSISATRHIVRPLCKQRDNVVI